VKMRSKQLARSRVWIAGKGPTVVVVHGGPGFNHRYLTSPLLPLTAHFRLLFYDQRSRGAVTPAALTEQLRGILIASNRAEGPPFVLAHSWGTYLALACLTAGNAPEVRGAVLLSPVPLTLDGFNRAGARFERSLPKPAPTGIRELFPYYLAKQNRGAKQYQGKTPIPIPQFNAAINEKVTAALQRSSYDFRRASRLLPKRTHFVFGRQDLISKASDFKGVSRSVAITNIPGAAHFAFAEQPEAFRSVVLKTFA
jgi:pimeloyl-ACP methyl ester carboxylesterase